MWKMSRWYSTPEHSSAVSTALTAAPVSGGAPAVRAIRPTREKKLYSEQESHSERMFTYI